MGDILSLLPIQARTLRVVDLSYNPGFLEASIFQGSSWSACIGLKKLRLCGAKFEHGSPYISLFSPWVLGSWRLEELSLDRTPLNEPTVQSIVE
jgi:hypothetical protein